MNIFIAGASGAIGQPLVSQLVALGHQVTGLTRNAAGVDKLQKLGAKGVIANAFDPAEMESVVRAANPEVVIDELTSLPRTPSDIPKAAEGDRRIRVEGGGNLFQAAIAGGARRYIQQASAFFLAPGNGLADESVGLAVEASPFITESARTYAGLEERVLGQPDKIEGVALRYGFFYGPGTWYHPDGACADQARRRELPMIGEGTGYWNWIHIEDAASATVAALESPIGVYHIVNDEPTPMHAWLPAFAKFVDAPEPPRLTVEEALQAAGPDAVYYQNRLRAAANAKAKRILNWQPRRLEWFA